MICEIFRDANNNFQLIFPLVSAATARSFVTGMATDLDSNTIVVHYRNTTPAWTTATFSGTPAELGSSGHYHISILASWFTNRDDSYPIIVWIVDDATPTKQWKDQSILIQPNLEINKLHVTRADSTQSVYFNNNTGKGLEVRSGAGNAMELISPAGKGLLIDAYLQGIDIDSETTQALKAIGATDGAYIKGTAGKGLHLQAASTALHLESLTSGIGLDTTAIQIINTGFATVPPVTISAIAGTVPALDLDSSGGHGIQIQGNQRGIDIQATNQQALYLNAAADDAFKMVGAGGNKDIAAKEIDDLVTKTTAIHAELPSPGPIASQDDVQAIQNNTKMRISVPPMVQIPDTGTRMIPIKAYFFDSTGNPEDPDNNEIAIQARATNQAVYKNEFYNDETGSTTSTASTTFTPNFWKMVRTGVGQFETFYKLPSTEITDIWVFTLKLEENAVELAYPTNMKVCLTATSTDLSDTVNNRQIIAKSLKIEDVSAHTEVDDSVYKDLKNDLDKIVGKLPVGNISGLDLGTVIDGKTVEYIFELIMALVNGRYLQDSPVAGQLTIFKRDNSSVLSIVKITDLERSRIS